MKVIAFLVSHDNQHRWLLLLSRVPKEADRSEFYDTEIDMLGKRFDNTFRNSIFEYSGLDFVWAFEKIKKRCRRILDRLELQPQGPGGSGQH